MVASLVSFFFFFFNMSEKQVIKSIETMLTIPKVLINSVCQFTAFSKRSVLS